MVVLVSVAVGGEKLDLIYGLEYEVLKDLLGPCNLDHVDEGTFEVTVLKPWKSKIFRWRSLKGNVVGQDAPQDTSSQNLYLQTP